jgi:hypothetical protein
MFKPGSLKVADCNCIYTLFKNIAAAILFLLEAPVG